MSSKKRKRKHIVFLYFNKTKNTHLSPVDSAIKKKQGWKQQQKTNFILLDGINDCL